ncbi:aldose 1-epimerase [Ktedonospora formicarum]|uniref:Aldose 1-epimerase n=1 Tax=Ktedonospora formicarum TaxID=2778364 RepID=A0A8J3HYI1_9CHLR|nr:aldose 1-epimerase [Ktedonospora formicarum]GHO42858.1 aldose 1-epimerase [Ktedonospora formicarum]
MTDQQHRGSAINQETESPFGASISTEAEIASTVITLTYTDPQHPAHSIEVGIAPELGSNMFRFRVGNQDLIYSERDLLKRMDFTGNFVLWPFPNRIRDQQYRYQGQSYSLKEVPRPQGNAVLIHGLVFDRAWQYEQPVITTDAASVTTFVEMDPASPYFASYPFPSRLSLTYTLTKQGVNITYHVENKGSHDLPFGFALHPYFILPGGADKTYVQLPAEAVMEADDELLPTKRVFDVNKLMYAMYDLRQPRPLDSLLLDHVYTNLHTQESAILDYREQGMQLRISASDDFTHIVIYVPKGEPYCCVEYQTCSTDAVNLHNQGARDISHLLEVAPGESYTGSIHYTLAFDK